MIVWLGLAAVAFWLLGGPRLVNRLAATDMRALLSGGLALAGVVLVAFLVLTGRGTVALAALTLFGPALWQAVRGVRPSSGPAERPSAWSGASRSAGGAMTRDEAYEVLGLRPGATAAEVRAAHLRLMRAAHPDTGGSDWVAARVNQARDVLLAG